jgi:predicted Zn-dependent peptidase
VLFDVITNPSFLPENIRMERKVIMEEIKMIKDNPSDDIFNHFYKVIFNKHPLSLYILGTHKSLKGIKYNNIRDYFDSNFNLRGMVLSAAGNIKHKVLIDKVKKYTEGYKNKKMKNYAEPVSCTDFYRQSKKVYKSNLKSSHLCYGTIGCSRKDPEKYSLSLFTNILGGSMSSRLFQKIREEKGLCYAIFSSNTQYSDAGIIIIYAATSTASIDKIIDLINMELLEIKKKGISERELEIAKENTKGNIVIGVENISSRMFRLGKALLLDGKVLTIDEILKRIDKISLKDINHAFDKYFNIDNMSTVIIAKNQPRRPKLKK